MRTLRLILLLGIPIVLTTGGASYFCLSGMPQAWAMLAHVAAFLVLWAVAIRISGPGRRK